MMGTWGAGVDECLTDLNKVKSAALVNRGMRPSITAFAALRKSPSRCRHVHVPPRIFLHALRCAWP